MKKILALFAGCLLVASVASGAPAVSDEQIKAKAQTCAACHGPDGNGILPIYPRLAGQYHDYLARALHEYKTGGRKNPIMAGFAATLSDGEIDGLARYYGAMPGKLDDLSHYEQGD
jgi:cytochrome c553